MIPRVGTRPSTARASARVVVLALCLAMVPSVVAHAHPFIVGGGRIPVQSLATIELDLAHGCGDERSGGGLDTEEVALEVPPWLRVVAVPEPDGWLVERESQDGYETAVIIWTARNGSEPAPRFRLSVVVDGEAGQTRYLRVSQRCGERVERWIGTPDAPAEQPAVRVLLTDADPDSPPPPPAPAETGSATDAQAHSSPSPVEDETDGPMVGPAVDRDVEVALSARPPLHPFAAPAGAALLMTAFLIAQLRARRRRRDAGTWTRR